MYLYDRMRVIYNTCSYGSVDYLVAEYVLTHMDSICEMTLSNVAKELSISKSAVSKFFSNQTRLSSYADFINNFKLEYLMYYKNSKQYRKELEEYLISQNFSLYNFNMTQIQKVAKILKQSEKVIFSGSLQLDGILTELIQCMLMNGVKTRFITSTESHMSEDEIFAMTERDADIVFCPEYSMYDFQLRLYMSLSKGNWHTNIKAKRIYIGKKSDTDSEVMTFEVPYSNNPFEQTKILRLYINLLLYEYLK